MAWNWAVFWEVLKGVASVLGVPLFLILCKRIEKFLDSRDALPEKNQTEVERLRDQVKTMWDETHVQEQRLLVILGLLAGLARRTDALAVDLDGIVGKGPDGRKFAFQESLDDVKIILAKVNELQELKP